jgi:PQQ-like domain
MRFSAAVLICLLATGAVAESAGTWPTFQGNNQHTGFANVVVNPAKFQVLWTRKVNHTAATCDASFGRPVISDNAVYFHYKNCDADQEFMLGLNAQNGATLWQSNAGFKFSDPSVDNGKLYFLSEVTPARLHDTRLHIVNAMTGQSLATTSLLLADENWFKQTPVVENHQVFIGGSHIQYNLDADTGVERWKSGNVEGDELLATLTDNYAMRYMYNSIALLDKQCGAFIRSIPVIPENMVDLTKYPLIFDKNSQTIFASFTPGDMCPDNQCMVVTAIDLQSQTSKWGRLGLGYTRQLAFADGHLFMILRDGDKESWLVSVNAVSGRDEWDWQGPKLLNGQIIVTPNAIIMNANSVVYFLSRETHQLMGFVAVKSSGTMAVAGDVLYVTDGVAGTVTAVRIG